MPYNRILRYVCGVANEFRIYEKPGPKYQLVDNTDTDYRTYFLIKNVYTHLFTKKEYIPLYSSQVQ